MTGPGAIDSGHSGMVELRMEPAVQEMTNAEFARRVGCHPSTVSRWRNDDRLPGVLLLDRIATEFGFEYETVKRAWLGGKKEWGKFIRTRIFKESQ